MISILVGAGVALGVTLLGTPLAIRVFRVWGLGQPIQEDGPHTHLVKVGTPTMGGTVLLVGFLLGYLAHASRRSASHRRESSSRSPPWGSARRLPRRLREGAPAAVPRPDQAAEVRGHRARLHRLRGDRDALGGHDRHLDAPVIRAAVEHRARGVLLRVGVPAPHVVVERDEPHRRPRRPRGGSSVLVLSAYIFISFWQFRPDTPVRCSAPRTAATRSAVSISRTPRSSPRR
jgi:hypothetical protein